MPPAYYLCPFLPCAAECGEYLALDLGGTNFRVLYVVLKDGKFVEEVSLRGNERWARDKREREERKEEEC